MNIADKIFGRKEEGQLNEYREAVDKKMLPDGVDRDILASWLELNNIKLETLRVDTTMPRATSIVGMNKINGGWYEIDFIKEDFRH